MQPTPIKPTKGQESVWDYPRPPRLERFDKSIQIVFNGVLIADTRRAYRVLETSHPPGYYIPQEDIRMAHLESAAGRSLCEWKGAASYFSVVAGDKRADKVAWAYAAPTPTFRPIANYLSFYAGPMDRCTVDGITVVPQPGGFYGGWITPEIVGPFKGVAGSWGW